LKFIRNTWKRKSIRKTEGLSKVYQMKIQNSSLGEGFLLKPGEPMEIWVTFHYVEVAKCRVLEFYNLLLLG
jgi:hypothetical protein